MVSGAAAAKKDEGKKYLRTHPFFEKKRPNHGIGQTPNPKKDLTYYVKWPKCVQLQRKRAILLARLKAPAAIRHFRDPVSKNEAVQILKLLSKYRPETKDAKKERLVKEAEARVNGDETKFKKPVALLAGINDVTAAVERKQAKLVVIAHDVDPIELVIWLPALCKKMQVPCVVIKGRARLGTLVHQKKCAVVALGNVRKEDQNALEQLVKNFSA